jgi:hypothetical protein
MDREMRRTYLAQGATETDLQFHDVAAVVPGQGSPNFLVTWRRWPLAHGFIAFCPRCKHQAEFEEVTKAGRKSLRFKHCGRLDKLPLLLRWFG